MSPPSGFPSSAAPSGGYPRQPASPASTKPEREGWLGEAEGLKVSLAAANAKLAQVDRLAARRTAAVGLGMPAFRDIAGRTAPRQGPGMTSPARLATALRAHAQGLYCLEAAAELLISQSWLHRADFTSQFVHVQRGLADGPEMATIDWPAAITALGASLPCSGGEQRMLKITASLADGIPVNLQDTLTGLDDRNIQLLITAVLHASGQRPAHRRP